MKMKLHRVWFIPALVALLVRLGMYWEYWYSPLRYFHKVPGLDMETLLRFSQWPGEFAPRFVVHRFIIFIVWFLNGKSHCVELVVAIQALLGILCVILVTEIARMCSGSRRVSIATGIVYALYGPLLLYEFVILQETVVLTLFWLAFWAVLRNHIHKYRGFYGFSTGIFLILALIGRPIAIIFVPAIFLYIVYQLYHKNKLLNLRYVAAGMVAMYLLSMSFNSFFASTPRILFQTFSYVAQANNVIATPAAKGDDIELDKLKSCKLYPYIAVGIKAFTRLPKLLLNYEIPENINYHTIADKFILLKILPGPKIVMFLGVLGLMAMLFKLPLWSKEHLILLPLLLLSLPLCAREAIGRYRLMLMPGTIFLVVWLIYQLIALKSNRKHLFIGLIAGILVCGLIYPKKNFIPIRVSDYISWGWAQEEGGNLPYAVDTFSQGWRFSGYKNQAAGVKTILLNLRLSRPDAALLAVAQGLQTGAVNRDLFNYYGAITHFMSGNAPLAQRFLSEVNPKNLDKRLQERYLKIAKAIGLRWH